MVSILINHFFLYPRHGSCTFWGWRSVLIGTAAQIFSVHRLTKKKKSLQSGGWLGGGGGGREWGGGQHNFDPGLKIIWLAHYGPCLLVIKERLGAQWPKWLQSWCVAELSRWKKTGNCKAHLPFNGHFVLVWLLSQRSGKIY